MGLLAKWSMWIVISLEASLGLGGMRVLQAPSRVQWAG